jgi:hypothetical protein
MSSQCGSILVHDKTEKQGESDRGKLPRVDYFDLMQVAVPGSKISSLTEIAIFGSM